MITKRELKKELEFFKDLCKRLENASAEEARKEILKQQMKKHSPGVECKGCKNLILHATPLSGYEFYCKLDRNCNDFEEETNNEDRTLRC